ncbi:MAG: carbon-nitrogen hydrolase family protein [Sulfurimonas sp.]
MMTSKAEEHTLCSLLFKTTPNYNTNLQTLLTHVNTAKKGSIIVAPEVCLTGFDYEHFDAVLDFAQKANAALREASKDKIIILTIIEKIGDEVFNFVKVFHNGEIVHQRAKAKLFRFGGEHKYFVEGKDEDVKVIEVDGIKIALLICFELRFKNLWLQIEGADIVAVPSWWGVARTEHFKSLTQTLAIINQCYLVASDSLNDDCSKMSCIVNPQGKVIRNAEKELLEVPFLKQEITLMRRYMDVGIK